MAYNDDKKTGFGTGILIGAIAGALAALFLTPKTGKEMREEASKKLKELNEQLESGELQDRATQVFGDAKEESMKIYSKAREQLVTKYNEFQEMDPEQKKAFINDIIQNIQEAFSNSTQITRSNMENLRDSLMEEAGEAVEDTKKDAKKRQVN